MSHYRDLPKLHELIKLTNKNASFQGTVLALDPGETTGWAVFARGQEKTSLIDAGQLKTWPLEVGVATLTNLIGTFIPDKIAYETYHIYGWKGDQHKFSEVNTIQVIGCIKTLAIQRSVSYTGQTAQVAKGFCGDQKLESWNLWLEGIRHARDAIRHGCFWLLFGDPKR